jgi:hypothetical protein
MIAATVELAPGGHEIWAAGRGGAQKAIRVFDEETVANLVSRVLSSVRAGGSPSPAQPG